MHSILNLSSSDGNGVHPITPMVGQRNSVQYMSLSLTFLAHVVIVTKKGNLKDGPGQDLFLQHNHKEISDFQEFGVILLIVSVSCF